MDAHNIGGLRRIGGPLWDIPFRSRWETADIAILVFVYRREMLVAKKIALLQSKRLYPENNEVEEDDEIAFFYGMNSFIRREDRQSVSALHRDFVFNEACRYGALHAGSEQIKAIEDLNRRFGKTVYYLFYNPHVVPHSVTYPLQERIRIAKPAVGCRILDANSVHRELAHLSEGESPSFAIIERGEKNYGWPLEVWAADMMLTCQVGQQFDNTRDDQVRYFLERRSGPIGAAVAVSVTLPEG